MNGQANIPTVETLKTQAKKLRSALQKNGDDVSHSRSLELLASQLGFRDWNTLHAAAGNQTPTAPFSVGQRVSGTYLKQAFSGEVVGLTLHQSTNRFLATFQFDSAVDVVRFDGMTNLRKRVSCNIDKHGHCTQKTSDGVPYFLFDA